jgi:periplasmic nitrate reductase NapD
LPISSLIAQARPDAVPEILEQIARLEGAEIVVEDGGRIAIVTETSDRAEDARLWTTIESLPGVARLDMIYHNFEDVEEASA